jgi:nucleoside-diphosphate-sugar epimerase
MLEHLNTSPMPPARTIVLGAGGFVGGAIVRQLARDGVAHVAVTRRECDLLAADAADRLRALVQPTDAVVLVSAIAPTRTATMLVDNIRMADAVCTALTATAPAHLVYISSDAVYDDDANPVTESSPRQPSSLHGMMHAARELVLRTAVKAPLAILRPSLLYGAGDPHNGYGPNRFRRQAARGETIGLFGGGEEMRDHIFIDDVGALTALVLSHRSRGALNVATGVSTSFHGVAEAVVALAPKPVEIKTSPRQNPITHRHFDITGTLKAFPTFRYTPLADGLRRASQET